MLGASAKRHGHQLLGRVVRSDGSSRRLSYRAQASDGNHGRGITIRSWSEAEPAYDAAKMSETLSDVTTGAGWMEVVAVAERVPAHVVGDGKSTIEELIEQTNLDPNRGEGHDNVLTRIEVDRTSYQLLERHTLSTVLPPGEVCYLRATANLSTGGIA